MPNHETKSEPAPNENEAERQMVEPGLSAPSNEVSDNEYWNYCDNCGTRLETFRCRYVCPKCGFFHSCSEP